MVLKVYPSELVRSKLRKETTLFFSFSDPLRNDQFNQFKRSDVSLGTYIVLQTIVSVISTYFKLVDFFKEPSWWTSISLFIGIFFVFLAGWFLCYLLYKSKYHNDSLSIKTKTFWLPMLESTWLLGNILALQSSVITILYSEHGAVPPTGFVAAMILVPIVCVMVVKSIKSEVVLFSCFLNTAGVVLIISNMAANDAFAATFMLLPMYFMSTYEFQRQNISLFLTVNQFSKFFLIHMLECFFKFKIFFSSSTFCTIAIS